ncbi:MAG: hypothetical protein U1F41_16005 [Burkholderiales bacterium]
MSRFWSHFARRRERWTLTWPARAIVLMVVGVLALGGIRNLYIFLSPTQPAGGKFLVVEGWMPKFAYRSAASIFREGKYAQIIAVSVVLEDGFATIDRPTDSGLESLVAAGVPQGLIAVASYHAIQRDRTYHAALAVREWMRSHGILATSVDIVTLGAHARRSRLLYQEALGDGFRVGVISIEDPRIDPLHWWRTSEGARSVIGETIGYVYARLLFNPE